jgi:leucyl aminopeptidase
MDDAFGGALSKTLTEECFKASLGKSRIFKARQSDGLKSRWLMILGLSQSSQKVKTERLDRIINAYQKAFAATFSYNEIKNITLCLGDEENFSPFTQDQLVFAAAQGAYKATYKTAQADAKKIHSFEKLTVLVPKALPAEISIKQALKTAQAESFVNDLANEPANLKMAKTLVDAAKTVESLQGVKLELEGNAEVLKKEMPAFWAVGQAAEIVDPPQYIKLHYRHPNCKANAPKVALVGKGVIFDTGGVQVKPDAYMNDMKFDMTGAATVLGVLKAIAEMQLDNIDVTAYVAACKNLTGETAYLPDSIINTANGKKIEVRHTDAEGRITLADSVHKATLDKPDEMITIATLTGAAMAAVGPCTALMGNNELQKQFIKDAFDAVGEGIQKLDFIEEDYENVESDLDGADVRNTSKGKGRGHLTAGAFVLGFANDINTCHLDIAGGDAKDGKATGIAVKGLIEYVVRKNNG